MNHIKHLKKRESDNEMVNRKGIQSRRMGFPWDGREVKEI